MFVHFKPLLSKEFERNISTMTPPEKSELRFVFGDSFFQTQSQLTARDGAETPDTSVISPTTEILSLRRTNLTEIPDYVLRQAALTYLCLEGNQLTSVPPALFLNLPKLEWLDLRKNQITCLPAEIGSHRCLRTLALEGNPITELPPELGNVTTLTALCLRDCPIRFPPLEIVQQGYKSILRHLRGVLAERTVSVRKVSPVVEVEKLQLSELIESRLEEPDEEPEDKDEMKKFRELQDKFIQLDIAERRSTVQKDKKPKLPSAVVTPKRPTKISQEGVIPEFPLSDSQLRKRPQERRKSKISKDAVIPELPLSDTQLRKRPQEKRGQATPRRKRIQTKRTQEKKNADQKHKKQDRQKPLEVPFINPITERRTGFFQRMGCMCTEPEDRYAHELQREICACAERMQERHRYLIGSETERMAVKEEDVREMRRLQERLLERSKNRTKCKRCFYSSTEDPWQSLFR